MPCAVTPYLQIQPGNGRQSHEEGERAPSDEGAGGPGEAVEADNPREAHLQAPGKSRVCHRASCILHDPYESLGQITDCRAAAEGGGEDGLGDDEVPQDVAREGVQLAADRTEQPPELPN